jgi:hypothetical protein
VVDGRHCAGLAVLFVWVHDPKFTECHHSPQLSFAGKFVTTSDCLFSCWQVSRTLLRDALSVTDIRRETWETVLAALGDSSIVQRRMAMKYLPSLIDVPERFSAPPPLAMGKSPPYLLISRCHKTFKQRKLALRALLV